MSNYKIKGEYVFMLGDSPENMREVARFNNLITNVGLDAISTQNLLSHAYVGTGNNPPNINNTSLVNHIASQALSETLSASHIVEPQRHTKQGFRYRFGPNVGTGNIAEVGVGFGIHTAANKILFSRALILDGNNNPTVITKLPTDYLDLYYYVSIYMDTEDVVQQVMYKGNSVEWRCRPASIQNYTPSLMLTAAWGNTTTCMLGDGTSSLGLITGGISSSFVANVQANWSNKVSGNYYREIVMIVPFTTNNTEGSIGTEQLRFAANVRNGGTYQSSFTPPLVKTQDEQLTIVFRINWGRL